MTLARPERRQGGWQALAACLPLAASLALAGCGSSPTPTPAPSVPATGDQVIAAFLDLVTAPDFTTETTMTASMVAGGVRVNIEASGRLSGNDGEMTMTLSEGQNSLVFEAVFIGDAAYLRAPGAEWQQVERSAINASGAQLDSFEFLTDAGQLRYRGTTTRAGEEVHEIVNEGAISFAGVDGATPSKVGLLRILVREDGTPISMSYRIEATTQDETGSPVRAVGDVEQTFANVGDPISIEVPV